MTGLEDCVGFEYGCVCAACAPRRHDVWCNCPVCHEAFLRRNHQRAIRAERATLEEAMLEAMVTGRSFVRLTLEPTENVFYGCACNEPCEHGLGHVAELGYN